MSMPKKIYDSRLLSKIYSFYSPLVTDHEINDFISHSIPGQDIGDNPRSFINSFLIHNYPNESVIKSSFIKRHIIETRNKQVAFFEMPVNRSRVDLCRVNGKSIAYEIKTDFDQLTRIEKQISDYSAVFEYVYVICSKNRVDEIIKTIDQYIGIVVYKASKTGNVSFSCYRKAEHSPFMSAYRQLTTLTKKEVIENFPVSTDSSNKEVIIREVISKYNADIINSKYKMILKERYEDKWKFLQNHIDEIYDIDYQFFFKNNISPSIIYQK